MDYVAFLRAINVGGKNSIKMSDLRQIFQSIGLEKVTTYIQSGNVLFSSEKSIESLANDIEDSISQLLGLSVPVIIRSISELESLLINNPLDDTIYKDLYFFMYSEELPEKDLLKINSIENGCDKYIIAGANIYAIFDKSIRESKLASILQKIGVRGTSRNKRTIEKIIELSKL